MPLDLTKLTLEQTEQVLKVIETNIDDATLKLRNLKNTRETVADDLIKKLVARGLNKFEQDEYDKYNAAEWLNSDDLPVSQIGMIVITKRFLSK